MRPAKPPRAGQPGQPGQAVEPAQPTQAGQPSEAAQPAQVARPPQSTDAPARGPTSPRRHPKNTGEGVTQASSEASHGLDQASQSALSASQSAGPAIDGVTRASHGIDQASHGAPQASRGAAQAAQPLRGAAHATDQTPGRAAGRAGGGRSHWLARPGGGRSHWLARHWVLVPILVLAAGPRLWGLGGQPVLFFDSGVYLGEGIFLASAAQRAAAAVAAPGPGSPLDKIAAATQTGTAAHPPDIAKPGHAILLALGLLALNGNAVLAGGLVSALAGLGTVAATYALGMLGWGRWVAAPAALVLAVSGQHLVYSREPLVEADGLFFATAASLVYLASARPKARFLAGLLFGLAFTCNNRVAYIPLVLAVVDLLPWRGLRQLGRWAVPVGVGFVVPPAVIELAYLAARGIGRTTSSATDWLDYVQQLVAFSRMNPPDRLRFDEWPTYFVDVALMDGVLVLALFVVGTITLLAKGRGARADRLLLGSLLVPLAIYSVYSTGEVRMRHFSLALPWLALAAALGMLSLGRMVRRARLAPAVLTAIVVLLALPRAVSLATPPSGMPVLLQALANQSAAATDGPVLSVFVGEGRTNARLRPAFVDTPADLRDLSGTYPLMVVDMQAYLFPGELTDRFDRVPPRLSAPNGNATWYLADLLEHHGVAWGGWGDLLDQWTRHAAAASTLRLYAMPDLLGA